jgi:hypothetical protein
VTGQYDDRWGRAMGLTMLGQVDLADGDHVRALERFAEAATLFQEIGNPMYRPGVSKVSQGSLRGAVTTNGPRNSTVHVTRCAPRLGCCYRRCTRPHTNEH